jgi:hypothetical protein
MALDSPRESLGRKEPPGRGPSDQKESQKKTQGWGAHLSPARHRLSQLFPAFVWGTLASKTARMRRCIDQAAELSRGTTVARQIE